ncbi:5193_t:CDS:2 [Ambispora leptoticha]|uniref:5193_t:CDS:1 n=1 Tax=Ambispora leptoticha TaxID=144679 RepID=A0A9N9AE35_9GLOM|nr:5193_t:CDS:2 [Ambispora leptoticha]
MCDRGKFTEADGRRYKNSTYAVAYLHANHIAHCENLLYKSQAPDSALVLAPEILNRVGYSKSVDLWSIGLCGYAPARNEDRFATTEERNGLRVDQRFYYPPTKLRSEKRPTAEQALKHKWLTGKTAMDIDLLSDFVENFNARGTFGRAVEVVQAASRLKKNAPKKPDSDDDEEELQNEQENHNHNQKQAQDTETDPDVSIS